MLLVRKSWVCQRKTWVQRTKIAIADKRLPRELPKAATVFWIAFPVPPLFPNWSRWLIWCMRKQIIKMPMNESRYVIDNIRPRLKLSSRLKNWTSLGSRWTIWPTKSLDNWIGTLKKEETHESHENSRTAILYEYLLAIQSSWKKSASPLR